VKVLAVALALALMSGPALASEPVDLAQGQAAPFAGTLTESGAWIEAAQRRQELERQVAELKARPCAEPRLTTGLIVAGALVAVGFLAGFLVTR
jgi:hypothetical protein